MRRQTSRSRIALRCVIGLAFAAALAATAGSQTADHPRAKVVVLDPQTTDYMRVLGGPPATVTMRSGFVVLAPGQSVGKHSTDEYEEAVVVLEGEGVMVGSQGDTLSLTTWSVAYCPPRTEHNVTNTGNGPLRYVYLVALAEAPK